MFFVKAKPEHTHAAYMSGENVEVGSDQFVSVGDQRAELKTGGLYIENTFGEGTLNNYVIIIGIAFLVILTILALV
jgi:hypothetical protein